MKISGLLLVALAVLGTSVQAQNPVWLDRLPAEVLDVSAPYTRVSGVAGQVRIEQRACRTLPIEDVRRRIVNTATQEWAFFGFGVQDQTVENEDGFRRTGGSGRVRGQPRTLTSDLNVRADDEVQQIALSVGGYWSATPDGSWMLERQNESWQGPLGFRADWRDLWSAAFISWVMCESGLGEREQFQRSIAHHDYIDQAILARDGAAPEAAFVAYDVGEAEIIPGDLICRASRPDYANIAARRIQIDLGARSHCDIVVKLDEEAGEILAIGGNVGDSVRLKRLPAAVGENGFLQNLPYDGRQIFAHLKLRTAPIEPNALDASPTMAAISCVGPLGFQVVTAGIAVPGGGNC